MQSTKLYFLRHYPYAEKHDGSPIDRLRGLGAGGDTITLSFSIVASHDVGDVLFEAGGISNSDNAILPGCVEVYIVKVWEQAGIGRKQAAGMLVRELLLKDDRQQLKDRYRRGFKCWRQFKESAMFYCPPNIRLSGTACTSLSANVAKQIWLSIRIPDGTKPGTYTGVLTIETKEPTVSASIDLEIEVLDFRLSEPKQDLMIFYKGTLDATRPQFYVNGALLRRQLQDIFDHGFRSITIDERHPNLAQKMISICEEIGFNRNFVLVHPHFIERLTFQKMAPTLYLSDELDLQTLTDSTAAIWHTRNHHIAAEHGIKTMASLWNAGFAEQFFDNAKIGGAPDTVLYNLSTNRKFIQKLSCSNDRTHSHYYYWNSHMEKPDVHRALAGVYLWKSKADGIAPYCYQHLPVHPFSPFNDYDEWEPGCYKGSPYIPLRQHCSVYPAKNGPIPTIQWEGMREGIIDLRYLTTLHEALDKARPIAGAQTLVNEVECRVAAFLQHMDLSQIIINSETNANPFPKLHSEDFQKFREQMAADIISLKNVIHSTLPSQMPVLNSK